MSGSNVINGKAFEYACFSALYDAVSRAGCNVGYTDDDAYNNAKNSYENLITDKTRNQLDLAALTTVKLLIPLEPMLLKKDGMLNMAIANDSIAKGVGGDVRDVIFRREENNWEMGISCKHNHEALKHPRLTKDKDFGKSWVDISCGNEYMEEITPTIDKMADLKKKGVKWESVDNKWEEYYIPILEAHRREINRMCEVYTGVPARLLKYFFGARDFYKVIMNTTDKTTTIEGFNMNGTLNAACDGKKAMTRIPVIKMPSRLKETDRLNETTIELTFDEGWTVSMRLHNKDRKVTPTSLAWDVQLTGLAKGVYQNTHSWYE